MDKLTEARTVLSKLYDRDRDDDTKQSPGTIVSNIPGYTVMISPNNYGEEYPMIDILKNEDLLRLYGYAERYFNGDESFEDFDGQIARITGIDDINDAFCDLWLELVYCVSPYGCSVLDFETYIKNLKNTHKQETSA